MSSIRDVYVYKFNLFIQIIELDCLFIATSALFALTEYAYAALQLDINSKNGNNFHFLNLVHCKIYFLARPS